MYNGVGSRSSYVQYIRFDAELAISAGYLDGCCLTGDIVLLCAYKFDKGRYIERWFFRGFFGDSEVLNAESVTVFSCV